MSIPKFRYKVGDLVYYKHYDSIAVISDDIHLYGGNNCYTMFVFKLQKFLKVAVGSYVDIWSEELTEEALNGR